MLLDSGSESACFANPGAPDGASVALVSDPDQIEAGKGHLFKGNDLASRGSDGRTAHNASINTKTNCGMDKETAADSYGPPKSDAKQSSKDARTASVREQKITFSIRNFLIILALSVHSIFEGMAIGEIEQTKTDVYNQF